MPIQQKFPAGDHLGRERHDERDRQRDTHAAHDMRQTKTCQAIPLLGIPSQFPSQFWSPSPLFEEVAITHGNGTVTGLIGKRRIIASALQKSPSSTTFDIVINAMPQPRPDTPWEAILEFRNDAEARLRRDEVRRWIQKITTQDLNPTELAEELEWTLREYERHMALHKMKANTGMFETLVTGTGELIENLCKLKVGAIAKMPFSMRYRKITLLEAEENAPGRELAYISQARDRFR